MYDPEDGHAFVRHEPNAASGGHWSDLKVQEFLGQDERNPEHVALLRLLNTSAATRDGS